MQSRDRVGLTLEAQMGEVRLAPGDVLYVVLSHLHGDHTGVAEEFGDAVFYSGADGRPIE